MAVPIFDLALSTLQAYFLDWERVCGRVTRSGFCCLDGGEIPDPGLLLLLEGELDTDALRRELRTSPSLFLALLAFLGLLVL